MQIHTIADIKEYLLQLEIKLQHAVQMHAEELQHVHPTQVIAAHNLIHYLLLRSEDIRQLQDKLHRAGLSSLTSSESHVYSQIQNVLERLGHIYKPHQLSTCTFGFSELERKKKSDKLFGRKGKKNIPKLMVTFDASFVENYALIKNLLLNGMHVARINCAHDNEAVCARMIQMIKRASRHTGLPCKIYMDLAGPKIRTQILGKGSDKGKVKVKEGELILLTESTEKFNSNEIIIGVNEPGIVNMLKKGERVFIDDGIIKGIVEQVKKNKVAVRIIRNSSSKQQIKHDKGINFPDSNISIAPLTKFDIACLPFIIENADMVGYSFVRYPSDLKVLQDKIQLLGNKKPNIIIKIETPEAVINLPQLLLTGMAQPLTGVMIARGDLAVEIGFERMSEVQEEILWICEAAHVPVIWATQVLESLNKSGMATRSEITDAGHAALAECVMINKGDHTIEVIETLSDVLNRIGGHQIKKRYTFRPLSIASNFIHRSSK